MVVLGVYRYGASFVLKFLRESTFRGFQVDPLYTNGSESSLGTICNIEQSFYLFFYFIKA